MFNLGIKENVQYKILYTTDKIYSMSQGIKYKLLLVSLARPSREKGLASETKLLPLQFCSLLIQILFDTAIETIQLGQ